MARSVQQCGRWRTVSRRRLRSGLQHVVALRSKAAQTRRRPSLVGVAASAFFLVIRRLLVVETRPLHWTRRSSLHAPASAPQSCRGLERWVGAWTCASEGGQLGGELVLQQWKCSPKPQSCVRASVGGSDLKRGRKSVTEGGAAPGCNAGFAICSGLGLAILGLQQGLNSQLQPTSPVKQTSRTGATTNPAQDLA